VNRNRVAPGVRRVDRRLHFLERQRLRGVDALVAAARAVDLDPIGAGIDARAGELAVVGFGRVAARRRESLAGDEHPWPDHLAGVDQIAHRVVDLAGRSEIANRGDAGLQRPPCVLGGEDGRHPRRAARLIQRPGSGGRIPEVGHVRVEIDQARDQREAPQVDDLGACRRRPGADRSDAVAVDQNHGVGDHLPAGSIILPARIAFVAANAFDASASHSTPIKTGRDHEDTKTPRKSSLLCVPLRVLVPLWSRVCSS